MRAPSSQQMSLVLLNLTVCGPGDARFAPLKRQIRVFSPPPPPLIIMRAGDVELNEDVQGVIAQFVGMRGAGPLRLTCKQLRDVVARVAWRSIETVRVSQLRPWRACFPRATAAKVYCVKDENLQWVHARHDHAGPVVLRPDHGRGPAAPGERDHYEPDVLQRDHGRGPAAPGERDHSEPDVVLQDNERGPAAPGERDHSHPGALRQDHGRGPAAPWERDHSEPERGATRSRTRASGTWGARPL